MDLQKSRVACVGMLAATVSFAVAKESPLSLPPGVKEKIDGLVQAQPAQRVTPGIAVAISKNGQTIYENTAGERDVSSHAPMLITTPQPIGSGTARSILFSKRTNAFRCCCMSAMVNRLFTR